MAVDSSIIVDFTVDQGSDYNVPLLIQSNNVNVDLTGYSAKMQLRKTYSGAVILTLSSTDGSITIANSIITLNFTNSITSAISFSGDVDSQDFVYDLEITNPSGKITRIRQGTLTLSREVTK